MILSPSLIYSPAPCLLALLVDSVQPHEQHYPFEHVGLQKPASGTPVPHLDIRPWLWPCSALDVSLDAAMASLPATSGERADYGARYLEECRQCSGVLQGDIRRPRPARGPSGSYCGHGIGRGTWASRVFPQPVVGHRSGGASEDRLRRMDGAGGFRRGLGRVPCAGNGTGARRPGNPSQVARRNLCPWSVSRPGRGQVR
jgi:hypothetical protein